jgi:class 3 adenylate cyclase/tetratricopeptide (TPR) repeat protein
MTCPRCAFENPPVMAFCGRCGTRLASLCLSCGFANPEGFAFCGKCGTRVSEAPAPSLQGSPPFASPQSYTPKHLAERILNSKEALEGERKQVTVLFADLKGSMELLADRDPEEARKLLDPVIEHMMEAVHRYEGTVNQVMGDGIMALFGAPVAHEDHALRACYAALRIKESIRRYAEDARRAHGINVQARIGLNSGEVVVRAIGSDLRMDYTAVGQTTHLAARMEQLAEPGTALLTPTTFALVEGYVTVRSVGPVPIKGLATPVEVYELTGAGAARSRLQATTVRGLTKFVGRSAELQHLTRVLELAGGGQGQVVTIMGEPGVGKSRLVWELTHSHRTQGWNIIEAGSVSHGKTTAYLPIVDLLRSYCRIEPGDDPRRIREKLAGKLLALDPALIGWLPALLTLFGVPTGDGAWDALDASLRRRRTLAAVRHVLLREAQVQPLLIVVEDLHWIDGETQAILDSLVESLPTTRILLLVNYRPEYSHAWGQKTYCSHIRLDSLSSQSAEELMDALLGADADLGGLRRLLVERTEGNPFFLEESVRALLERGELAGERGAYRLTRAIEAVHVPATVQSVLAARIDRLPPEHKRLLQTAAVIGKDVPLAVLESVDVEAAHGLHQSLSELQAAEFLYQTQLFPEAEYTFKHALTHEVAYGSLVQERRHTLHRAVLAAIERLYAGRLDEHPERLSLHAVRSESWDKAVAYSAEAAARARRRLALREALASLEQALAALAHLPRTRENLQRAVDLHIEARTCLVLLGDIAPMLGHLDRAGLAAEALEDDAQRARVAGYRAHTHWLMGQHRTALDLAEGHLALARRASNLDEEVSATFNLGEVRYSLGEFEQAAELLGRALGRALDLSGNAQLRDWAAPLEVVARRWRAQSLAELGRFDEAASLAREAIEIARARNHPYALANAISVWGVICARQGNFQDAIPLLEEGLQFARTLDFQDFVPTIGNLLAEARAQIGRPTEAQAILDEVPAFPRGGASASRPLALLLLGRVADAQELVAKALSGAQERGERGIEAWLLWLVGEIAARESPTDADTAAVRFREALALAEVLGMRPLAAHCQLGLGKLYRRTGQPEQAREYLATATTMYGEMDMRFYLEQAETELRAQTT